MIEYSLAILERLKNDRKGVTALEYAVLAAGLVVAIAASATTLGGKLTSTFARISGAL